MLNPQIETFISVTENGSFSKTAEIMFVSATAVMKQINNLEERLGVTLFERTNHGLVLTESGVSLLADAKYLIDYSQRAVEKAREIENKINMQSIRIGTSIMTPVKFLLDIWTEVQSHYPNLKIELIPFDNNQKNAVEILKNLGQHIDIVAGIYDNKFLQDRGCNATFLHNKKVMLAVPLSHEMCQKSVLNVEDFAGQRVMLIKKGWNVYIDNLREQLVSLGSTIEDFEMFNITAFNNAVKNNLPIITVEGWEDVHPLLKFVPSSLDCKIPFGIMHSPTPSKKVKMFIETLQKIVQNNIKN